MSQSSYVCPYCFSSHSMYEIEFRCMNLRCKPKLDIQQATYYGISPELKGMCFPVITESSFYMPEFGICPECHEETWTRICPTCHNTLPSTVDINNDLTISIVGQKDAGKSSYLGVLLYEMKHKIAGSLHGVASFLDKENGMEYEKRYGQFLYPVGLREMAMKIPTTYLGGGRNVSYGTNRPILCDFKLEKKGFFNQITIPYTFIFYDSIAEVLEQQEAMFTVSRHISHSKGLIFLIDPMQIPAIRKQIPFAVAKGSSNLEFGQGSNTTEMLLRLITLIRTKNHIPDSKKIEIPIVVALTKLDAVKELLPPNLWMFRESPHLKGRGYHRQDGWNVREEVQGLLYEWGQQDFLQQLEFHFRNYQLSVFSAFGSVPTLEGRLEGCKPHRIEDGVLWLMYEMGIIGKLD